jgi:hypothetical protein
MTVQSPARYFTQVDWATKRWSVMTGPNAIWLHDKLENASKTITFAENISNPKEKMSIYMCVCTLLNVIADNDSLMKDSKQELERLNALIDTI